MKQLIEIYAEEMKKFNEKYKIEGEVIIKIGGGKGRGSQVYNIETKKGNLALYSELLIQKIENTLEFFSKVKGIINSYNNDFTYLLIHDFTGFSISEINKYINTHTDIISIKDNVVRETARSLHQEMQKNNSNIIINKAVRMVAAKETLNYLKRIVISKEGQMWSERPKFRKMIEEIEKRGEIGPVKGLETISRYIDELEVSNSISWDLSSLLLSKATEESISNRRG